MRTRTLLPLALTGLALGAHAAGADLGGQGVARGRVDPLDDRHAHRLGDGSAVVLIEAGTVLLFDGPAHKLEAGILPLEFRDTRFECCLIHAASRPLGRLRRRGLF
mgnify:CR=1 FL=1